MNSMTGFGRGEARDEEYSVSVELSGVNRKQAEIALNLPRHLTALETQVRQFVLTGISRGRVGVSVSVERVEGAAVNVRLDEAKASAYAAMFERLSQIAGRSLVESVYDYMRIQGMEVSDSSSESDVEKIGGLVNRALSTAMEAFLEMRKAEGENMRTDLLNRLNTLETMSEKMKEYAPHVVTRFREALHRRLNEAGIPIDLDDERLVRELGIFAERCDVTEEFTRLDSHYEQFRVKCASSEPVGRPLDFLCQEIFREFNTIGSKANDASLAHLVVSAKTELEKIREQVQNVE